MSGQTTDHIRPSTHKVTASITRTSSTSPETRADVRNAARVFVELNVAGMGITLLVLRSPFVAAACHSELVTSSPRPPWLRPRHAQH
ncbi:hypothetical protein GCM10022232_49980 [Streptomyces plumbiresistens]|uniref:Uncharacterized protein n=1 Tax=Streptomyces plumbiresistens TaxID=511811 RepID=A0ABP7RZW9_9ACTN